MEARGGVPGPETIEFDRRDHDDRVGAREPARVVADRLSRAARQGADTK